jgi:hypothetical protein
MADRMGRKTPLMISIAWYSLCNFIAAVQMNFGFAMPMMISTILFLVLVVISVLLGPETKGKTLTADLEVIKVAAQPAT